jgi:hypothetical protein
MDGVSPEARLDQLLVQYPDVLRHAEEARRILMRVRDESGAATLVRLSAIEADVSPAVHDLIAIFEGLPVGPACTKLELWQYAFQRRSTRPPAKGST